MGVYLSVVRTEGDDIRLAGLRVGRGMPSLVEVLEGRAAYESPEQRDEAIRNETENLLSRMKTRPL
ncbi:MAG TPA: hypothetical protein PLX03_08620, partial [Candidatus Hydrogenedentes bacterium]|nr:hypothetical protein [Candidatus Hydrogenedentota bacterium]